MEKPDQNRNMILAWQILGYLCSHPEAKDSEAGICQWWLRGQGIKVGVLQVRRALEYLEQRGWLTTRGEGAALKVYGLNKERLQALH